MRRERDGGAELLRACAHMRCEGGRAIVDPGDLRVVEHRRQRVPREARAEQGAEALRTARARCAQRRERLIAKAADLVEPVLRRELRAQPPLPEGRALIEE